MEGLSLETAEFSNGSNKKTRHVTTMINSLIVKSKQKDSAEIILSLFLVIFNYQALNFETQLFDLKKLL